MKVSKLLVLSIVLLVMVFAFAMQSHAALELLGQGTSTHGTYNLIYDTDRDVTWYDYETFGYTWQNQIDWATDLSVTFGVNTLNDWRLPTVLNQDGSGPCYGYYCSESEMGHLYYTELGNPGGSLTSTGYFESTMTSAYWLSTVSASNPDDAWYFIFTLGHQSTDGGSKTRTDMYGIAVMDGRAIAPEPISSILFLTGGAVLTSRRYFRRKK